MVNFELGKERKKDFFVLSRAWDKEKILSPHEGSNLWQAQNLPSLLLYLKT